MFVAIRNPETGGVGTCAETALDLHRAHGWVRVSDVRPAPDDFHLADYVGAPDLDAPAEPEPKTAPDIKPARTTKEKQA